jgi:hypothetical protein
MGHQLSRISTSINKEIDRAQREHEHTTNHARQRRQFHGSTTAGARMGHGRVGYTSTSSHGYGYSGDDGSGYTGTFGGDSGGGSSSGGMSSSSSGGDGGGGSSSSC